MERIKVFLETGRRKAFAGAIDWPGWCRWGKGEDAALNSLLAYGGRYGEVVKKAAINFKEPNDLAVFHVVERHEGNATTDFGAHDVALNRDRDPIDPGDSLRWQRILEACWNLFDEAVASARGKTLKLGPRGGGRDLDKIMLHVLQADQAYLRRVAWKVSKGDTADITTQIKDTRNMIHKAWTKALNEGLPDKGPRGGKIWSLRFFVRRVTWHVLDHAWEIEDRLI